MRNYIIVLLVSLSLSACATRYVPYTGNEVAKLIIQNKSNDWTKLMTWSDPDQCQQRQYIDIGGGRSYEGNTLESQKSATIAVQPDRRFSIGFTSTVPTQQTGLFKYCNVAGIFTPEKDKTYVASFSTSDQGCSIEMHRQRRAETGEAVVEPIKFRFVRYVPSTATAPSMCIDR